MDFFLYVIEIRIANLQLSSTFRMRKSCHFYANILSPRLKSVKKEMCRRDPKKCRAANLENIYSIKLVREEP